jgi:four helix bundle protein
MVPSVFNFEHLSVYQKSLTLTKSIYLLTQTWPKEHLFGITDQLRRASYSISLNIAEGSSRTQKDFRHYLTMARGSAFECIPLIQLARSLDLLTEKQWQIFYNEIVSIAQMVSKLKSSVRIRSNESTK